MVRLLTQERHMLNLETIRNPEELARTVRALRAAADISQAQLAEAVGVSMRTISRLEHGDAGVSVRTVMDIFQHLTRTVQEAA